MKQKDAAFFDFDGTITSKDSFIEFIRFTHGSAGLALCVLLNLPYILLFLLRCYPGHRLKERFFAFFFKNDSEKELLELGKTFSKEYLPKLVFPEAMKKISWHKEQGHDIYIVTASSSIWLNAWCEEHGLKLISTEFEIENNKYTGKISGKNCFGKVKAERISEIIDNCDITYAYGNGRSDKHFLKLATHPYNHALNGENHENDTFNTLIFFLIIIASIALRFFHFGEAIDDPHGWRQCDTANYIRDFYRNGVDFFHPAVCWMGGYKTLILEFPLPEALVAWLSHIFGPSHALARCVFLFFFCGGVYYFYKICKLFLEKQTSRLATIIYTFLPLSYYYSRALHIDYFALSFAFAMFYYYAVGIKEQQLRKIIFGSVFATIAFLVKAPYAVCFALPLLYIIIQGKQGRFCLKRAVLFLVPMVLFVLWIRQSAIINAQAPDWYFIPGYRKFDDNTRWYFGAFEHRFIVRSWIALRERLLHDLTSGMVGTILLVAGILASVFRKKLTLLWLWFLGVVIYMLIFFNLNVLHNYYQIPFVPVFAIFMAIGISFISGLIPPKKVKPVLVTLLSVVLIYSCIRFSEKHFFTIEKQHQIIAKNIEDNTRQNDLIIVTYGGLSVHCPLILYRADRNGWSVPEAVLTPAIIYNLMKEGCSTLAYVGYQLPVSETGTYLSRFKIQDNLLPDGSHLFLVNLRSNVLKSL
ncbi:MAG: HAD-IB family hydrolase [Bacteroidota bacterium]